MLAPALRKLLQGAIHTSPVCRHRLLERGINTFPCLFVGAGSEVYTLSLFDTGF